MKATTFHSLTSVALGVCAMQLQTPLYSSYSFNPLQHLAGIAPYYEPTDPPRDPNPPQGCTVTRAAYLVRHAAINANDFDYEQYLQPFLYKLGNATVDWAKIPQLSFLAAWEPPSFGEQELLTRTGKVEAGQLGLSISYRYPKRMQAICGYDTVIRGSSPFCSTDLFSPDEWLQFEYGQDIQYHYNTGYGSPYAGAIGFPWVNATLNLLAADTSAQDMYVSFTHRELPPAALVAMGLFNNSLFSGGNDVNATMPLDQINYNRAWVSSRILPFLTNIAIERMNCSANHAVAAAQGRNMTSSPSATTYYRVLLSRSPQVLPGCFDGPGQSCSAKVLPAFLQQRADMFRNYSAVCGNTYKNSTDAVTFYTNSNNGTVVGKKRHLMW